MRHTVRSRVAKVLGVLALLVTGPVATASSETLPATRGFHLGFTPLPYDYTEEAFAATYALIRTHGDIIGHHLDEGVPWEASLSGAEYDPNVMADIARRRMNTEAGQTVFLSVTPLALSRLDLAGTWAQDSHLTNPAPFAGLALRDPLVKEAFTNYCLRMIEAFEPAYFAYAIEISDLAKDPVMRADFVELAKTVYGTVKARHPNLKVFPTYTLGDGAYLDEALVGFMRDLAAYTDVVAVSTYPYVWDDVGGNAARLPEDWFRKIAAVLPDKPFAVAETGFLAGDYRHLRHLVWIRAKPSDQATYVERLLTEAHRLNAEFVIWYVPVDYDRLWEKMSAQGMDAWFAQWMRSGLWDAALQERPALAVWKSWLALPYRP